MILDLETLDKYYDIVQNYLNIMIKEDLEIEDEDLDIVKFIGRALNLTIYSQEYSSIIYKVPNGYLCWIKYSPEQFIQNYRNFINSSPLAIDLKYTFIMENLLNVLTRATFYHTDIEIEENEDVYDNLERVDYYSQCRQFISLSICKNNILL